MKRLETYTPHNNYFVMYVIEDEVVKGFTVADNNFERVVDKDFHSAYQAITWADKEYKVLI